MLNIYLHGSWVNILWPITHVTRLTQWLIRPVDPLMVECHFWMGHVVFGSQYVDP